MNQSETASTLYCKKQLNMAERELTAFFAAVGALFGPEQAKLSAEDWLDGIEQVPGADQPTCRDWRAITVLAASQLAQRMGCAKQTERSKPRCKSG